MNNTAENDFFRFPKVKWLHLTGDLDKSVTFHVKSSQNLTCQKSLKSVILTEFFKIKGGRFLLGHICVEFRKALVKI